MVVRSDTRRVVLRLNPSVVPGDAVILQWLNAVCSTDIRGQLIGMTHTISDVLLDHASNYLKANGFSAQEAVDMSGVEFPKPEASSAVERTSFDQQSSRGEMKTESNLSKRRLPIFG
jgi:hypothetical protein